MSFDAMMFVLRRMEGKLTQLEKLTLVVLASYLHDKTGECFPSHATIAKGASATPRAIRQCLRRLEKCGFITVLERPRGTRSARYRLHLDAVATPERRSALTPEPRSPVGVGIAGVAAFGGERRDRLEGNVATGTPERRSPDLLDPSLKDQDQPASPDSVPFTRYAAIAGQVIGTVRRESEWAEEFKSRCAAQHLPYDGTLTRKALEAAVVGRDKAAMALLNSRPRSAQRPAG